MKVPHEAKKVFTGEIFDVYQWEQKMFDGSDATFEMIKRPDTIQIIAVDGEKIYLSVEEQPFKGSFIGMLGGRVEKGEEPLAAAKRELLEEAGFASNDWDLFKTYQPFSKMDWMIYLYIARNCKQIAEQRLDPGEKITLISFTFDEFIDYILSENFWGQEFVGDILRMKLEPAKLQSFKQRLFK